MTTKHQQSYLALTEFQFAIFFSLLRKFKTHSFFLSETYQQTTITQTQIVLIRRIELDEQCDKKKQKSYANMDVSLSICHVST